MKLRHSLLLLLPLCTLPAFASAAEGGCAAKAQDIQQQIDYATQHGNTHRVDGLKSAERSADSLYRSRPAGRTPEKYRGKAA